MTDAALPRESVTPCGVAQECGLHQHRFADNEVEQLFAEAWERECRQGRLLAYLLTPPGEDQRWPVEPSYRDRLVAATVVQWLGSPVGQAFVRDVLAKRGAR